MALPGAAKAVRDAGKADQIFVTGLSLPNTMRQYVEDGTIKQVRALEPGRPGLPDRARRQAAATTGKLADGRASDRPPATTFASAPAKCCSGPPKVFDRENIGQYDF